MSEHYIVAGRKVVPIRTEAELDSALAAGAEVQFTACGGGPGNDYDSDLEGVGSSGWIPAFDDDFDTSSDRAALRAGEYTDARQRLRAIYPADAEQSEAA